MILHHFHQDFALGHYSTNLIAVVSVYELCLSVSIAMGQETSKSRMQTHKNMPDLAAQKTRR